MIYTYLESFYYKLFKYIYIITFSLTFMKKLKFGDHVTPISHFFNCQAKHGSHCYEQFNVSKLLKL